MNGVTRFPALPEAIRRHLGCDGRAKAVVEVDGAVVSVGRAQRIVPDRTRIAVEERDGACRVPGCERTRWLQVHLVVHWEDGGATDTMIALCSRTTASTTWTGCTSPATPTTPTGWCSPTPRAGG